ncbi:ATP-binding protein [Sporosalibacterium faouarense]|uniref:ATP-binding protein n=1 Tax=Sporosalibacterium faouarense TaxID=516123 RepID=UPI00192C999C|nr:ATP-binding protein [Sporosalibacterium faouarense]
MFIPFFHNLSTITIFVFLAIQFRSYMFKNSISNRIRIIAYSLLGSALSVLTIIDNFTYREMIFDLRTVPIFLVSYFLGWRGALISWILPTVYRFHIGGPTSLQGVLNGIIVPAIIGSILCEVYNPVNNKSICDIKRIIKALLLSRIINAVLIWFTVDIEFIPWLQINIMITIFSIFATVLIFLIVSDYNKKKVLQEEQKQEHESMRLMANELDKANSTLNTIIDVMPVGVVCCDMAENVILHNSTAETIIGRVGHKIQESYDDYSVHKLDGTLFSQEEMPIIKSIRQELCSKDIEMLIKKKSDRDVIISVSSSVIKDEENNNIGAVAVFQDITEMKQSQKKLKSEKEINQAIFNAITESLLLINNEGKILTINPTGAKRLDKEIKKIVGKSIDDIVSDSIKSKTKNIVEELRKGKKSVQFQSCFSDRWFKNVIYPVVNDLNEITKFAVFSQDITEAKESEKANRELINDLKIEREILKQKNEELFKLYKNHSVALKILEQNNQELNIAGHSEKNLIANVSHELRTPLNIIMAYLEYFLEENESILDEEGKETLVIVYNNANRLVNMIRDMLNISILESDKMEFDFNSACINSLISELVEERRMIADSKDIKIHLNALKDNIEIITDSDRLRQVVGNILDNAIKFTNNGDINVNLENTDEKIKIYIKDNGIGIDEEHINKIFDSFYQVDNSSKKEYKGVGLGLSIAKLFVENLGGEIEVRNNIDKGATFIIIIPVECSNNEK